MPSKFTPSEDKSLVVAKELTADELNTLLQASGYASKPAGNARLSLSGQNLVASDTGETFIYNPVKKTPACTVRIVKPMEEYNCFWVSESVAKQLGRPDLAGTFSKKFFHDSPDRTVWDSDLAYDDIKARNDLIDDYGKPLKASWKGDIYLQIIPESGTLTGDETIYVLSMSTTSVIEFKGTSKSPNEGVVSDLNFIRKLSYFAMQNKPEDSTPEKAVIDALMSYTLGGVVAEVRCPRAEDKAHGTQWTVISFDPIHIEPVNAGPAIEAGDVEDEPAF